MFLLFMEVMRPGPETTVLDVGVTSDERYRESNYFEQMYPYPHNITCVGTEDGSHLAAALSWPELQAGAARRAAAVS